MASSANVRSVDALKRFRASLVRFCEVAARALGEADSEITRTMDWIEHTQGARWRREIKGRTEDISSARAAVFRRETRSLSETPGATEERKNLTTARVRLRDAEERTRTVKAWSRRLREEADRYHAMAERLSSAANAELPEAAIRLGRMIENLEAYLAIAGPAADGAGVRRETPRGEPAGTASMGRGAGGPVAGPPRPWWWRLRERAGAIGMPPKGISSGREAATIDGRDLAARLGQVRLEPLGAGETVVVEQGSLAEREFFLLRRRAGAETEWLVGSTEEAPPRQAVRLPAATVARRLGDLAGVLLLPPGWLAVVREGRLRLVADAEDRERLAEGP